MPNVIAKVPNLLRVCVAEAGASAARAAVEWGESPGYIQGLRHDPTPRKSLAT